MAELSLDQLKSLGWAQETTLRILSEKVGSSNSLLKAMATNQGIRDEDIKDFSTAVSEATSGLEEHTRQELAATRLAVNKQRAEREIEANKRELNSKYKESVDDLRRSLGRISNLKAENVFESVQGGIAKWSGNLSSTDGAFQGLGKSIGWLNKAVVVAAAAFGIYAETNKSFLKLVDTGLMFNGSLEQFAIMANKSGLGIQKFTEIATKYSQSVSMIGEKQFALNVRSFQDLSKASGYFGMMPEQLAQAQASYVDGLRESGLLHKLTADQQNASTKEYLSTLTGLSKLTGKQRDQLEAEQKAALAKQQIELEMRALEKKYGPEYAARVRRQYAATVSAQGEDVASAAFFSRFLGGVTREQAKLLGPTGLMGSARGIGASFGGTDEQMLNAFEGFSKAATDLPGDLLHTFATNVGFGGALSGTDYAAMLKRSEKIASMTPQDRAEVRRLMAGGAPTDKTNQQYLKTQFDRMRIEGDLKSATWALTEQMMIFNGIMGVSSFGTGIMASMASMVGPNGILTGILGYVGLRAGLKYLGRTGLFGGAGGLNALSNLTGGMGGRMGSLFGGGGLYGPPPPPGRLGGLLTGVGGPGSMMRFARGAGIGLVAEGANLALQHFAPEFSKTKGGSTLSTALQGAALGATIGSVLPVIGTGVGALLGGALGGLYGYVSTPSQDAGAAAAGGGGVVPTDLVSSTVALTTSLVTNGAYISALADMMTSVAAVQAVRGGAAPTPAAIGATPDFSSFENKLSESGPLYMLIQQLIDQVKNSGNQVAAAVHA